MMQILNNTIANIISGINALRSFLGWILAIPVIAGVILLLYFFIHLVISDMASGMVFFP
jgi:hypothetical protein